MCKRICCEANNSKLSGRQYNIQYFKVNIIYARIQTLNRFCMLETIRFSFVLALVCVYICYDMNVDDQLGCVGCVGCMNGVVSGAGDYD